MPPQLEEQNDEVTAGPSAQDWERMKANIKDLYIDQDLRLEDVRQIMSDQYWFNASENMYKKRLRKWKFWKYYRLDQKKAALTLLSRVTIDEENTTPIFINEKPLKEQRVKRFERESRKVRIPLNFRATVEERTHKQNRSTPVNCTIPTNVTIQAPFPELPPLVLDPLLELVCSSSISCINLIPSEESLRVEELLIEVAYYYRWRLKEGRAVFSDAYNMYPFVTSIPLLSNGQDPSLSQRLKSLLSDGLTGLTNERSEGWRLLKSACEIYPTVVRRQPCDMLATIIVLLSHSSWNGFSEVRTYLLQYMSYVTQEALGADHSLTVVLKLLCEKSVFANALEPVLQLFCNISRQFVPNWNSEMASCNQSVFTRTVDEKALSDMYYGDQMCLAKSYHKRGQFQNAETILRRLQPNVENIYGWCHLRMRRVILSLADIAYDSGSYVHAQKLLRDANQRTLSYKRKWRDVPQPDWEDTRQLEWEDTLAYGGVLDLENINSNYAQSQEYLSKFWTLGPKCLSKTTTFFRTPSINSIRYFGLNGSLKHRGNYNGTIHACRLQTS